MVKLLAVMFAVMACATLPPEKEDPLVACMIDPACSVIHVTNHLVEDVDVYLNGSRLGEFTLAKTVTLPLRQGMLDGARCTVARVHIVAVGDANSEKMCIQMGQHFTLDIFDNKIWLTPWIRKS